MEPSGRPVAPGHAQEQDENDLLDACLAGDTSAFSVLVRRHKREMLAFASRFCENRAEVDDLGQEIFCRAFEKLHTFRRKSSFRTWLYRIASNACVDLLRRRSTNPLHKATLPENHSTTATLGSQESTESRLDCRRLLARLSPKDRLVLTLLYMEGCSVQETAARSGLSAANVRVRAFRAKARLRACMEEEHGKKYTP